MYVNDSLSLHFEALIDISMSVNMTVQGIWVFLSFSSISTFDYTCKLPKPLSVYKNSGLAVCVPVDGELERS